MTRQINQEFIKGLTPLLGEEEARAVLEILLMHCTGLTATELRTNKHLELNELQESQIAAALTRLEAHEPIQYVIGWASFLGMELEVNHSVLIPRPETEELVHWILQSENQSDKSVLDICTGSGCIALALQKKGRWQRVAGLDVSGKALEVAQKNAQRLGLEVEWVEADILRSGTLGKKWDVIVANPPYVLPHEAVEMTKGVLEYEPGLALFIPENDPILFYKSIGKHAIQSLRPGGQLYFELNPKTASEVAGFIEKLGFENVEIRKDMFGKDRMLKARKPA